MWYQPKRCTLKCAALIVINASLIVCVANVYFQLANIRANTLKASLSASTTSYSTSHSKCKIVIDGQGVWQCAVPFMNGLFQHYAGHVFEIVRTDIDDGHELDRGSFDVTIRSQTDIDNGINDHILRFAFGNEWCHQKEYRSNPALFGHHSTIISHWYFDAKTDGNLSFWRSVNNAIVPIYLPNFFNRLFTDNYATELLPFMMNYAKNGHLWGHRKYMVSIVLSLHTGYRKRLRPLLHTIAEKKTYQSIVATKYAQISMYRKYLMASKFVACIDGNNPETFRIWESMSMAAIPILNIKNEWLQSHSCSAAFNGFLLFPNLTMQQIESKQLIFTEQKWYFQDLNVSKLLKLHSRQQFLPFILLEKAQDLEAFFDFVILQQNDDRQKSDAFWNVWQKLMIEWFLTYIEHKMKQLTEVMLSQFDGNCSII